MSTLKLRNGSTVSAEQHPFHIVDTTPLPIFMSVAIVIGLMHIAFISHPEFPIAEQGVLLAKITSG